MFQTFDTYSRPNTLLLATDNVSGRIKITVNTIIMNFKKPLKLLDIFSNTEMAMLPTGDELIAGLHFECLGCFYFSKTWLSTSAACIKACPPNTTLCVSETVSVVNSQNSVIFSLSRSTKFITRSEKPFTTTQLTIF